MSADPETWARRLVGRELNGRYRLDRLVGVGGMGAVYAAEHLAVGRRVAVKMLLPDLATDAQTVRRFHQEARSAAAVGRRGVVDILDFDHDPSAGPYLVMELLEGESLARRIERLGKLEPGDVLWVAESLLETLAKVHSQGIVHRDLKPDNVFVAREENEEVVKILDFGISRIMGGDPTKDSALLTRPGVVLGTPTYMAPEQARGDPAVDHRADLYAVGAILFECCAGRPPHVGTNWQQVFAMVLTAPPPSLRAMRPGLPDALYATVDRALAREPDQRFQNAEAMLASLASVSAPLPRTRGAEAADSFPRTRAQPITPMGNAWARTADAPPSTPYAVSTERKESGGRGGCLIAAALGLGLLVAFGGVGFGVYLAMRDDGGTDPRPVATEHPGVPDAGAAVLVAHAADAGAAPDAGGAVAAAASDAGAEQVAHAERGSGGQRGARAGRRTPTTTPATTPTTTPTTTPATTPTTTPTTTPATAPTTTPSAGGNVEATLRARLDAANVHRRAGRVREARSAYEDVVHLAWTAEVPSGSQAARHAAEARMTLGDMSAAGVRPFGRTQTPEEFSQAWQRVTGAMTRAAEQYGRVAMYGHTDLTQCGMVRSARLYEQLAEVAKHVQAPESIAAIGAESEESFVSGFRDTARSYLEAARTSYEASTNLGQGPCRAQAMDSLQRVLRALGRRTP